MVSSMTWGLWVRLSGAQHAGIHLIGRQFVSAFSVAAMLLAYQQLGSAAIRGLDLSPIVPIEGSILE
jgi:hypothetical protein